MKVLFCLVFKKNFKPGSNSPFIKPMTLYVLATRLLLKTFKVRDLFIFQNEYKKLKEMCLRILRIYFPSLSDPPYV